LAARKRRHDEAFLKEKKNNGVNEEAERKAANDRTKVKKAVDAAEGNNDEDFRRIHDIANRRFTAKRVPKRHFLRLFTPERQTLRKQARASQISGVKQGGTISQRRTGNIFDRFIKTMNRLAEQKF
jgi:hypothetical protein